MVSWVHGRMSLIPGKHAVGRWLCQKPFGSVIFGISKIKLLRLNRGYTGKKDYFLPKIRIVGYQKAHRKDKKFSPGTDEYCRTSLRVNLALLNVIRTIFYE